MRTNLTTYLPGLKQLTEGRKLTYIARQIGIDQSTLNGLVHCKRGASLAMALTLAGYFGVTVEELTKAREKSPA